jgi:hypothetical protein
MLQTISLSTADGRELFSGVSLLRSEPPPPPSSVIVDDANEVSGICGTLAGESSPSNDNGSRPPSYASLHPEPLSSYESSERV